MTTVFDCFFPTTVILVEDNTSFLETLSQLLCVNGVLFKRFSNPKEALSYINSTSDKYRLDINKLLAEPHNASINIYDLHKEAYSFDRFQYISAVITDYRMPEMDGLQLCSEIKDENISRVLLTGVAGDMITSRAFNDGLINFFLPKNVDNMQTNVLDCIRKAINQYFGKYTASVGRYLPQNGQKYLRDPVFANLFHNLCLSRGVSEYYLLNSDGSYLLLKDNGSASVLSVITESKMEKLANIAKIDKSVPSYIYDGIASRGYMLVSHDNNGQLPPTSHWGDYLYPARKISGYETYYFSVQEGNEIRLPVDRIKSFAAFKEKF